MTLTEIATSPATGVSAVVRSTATVRRRGSTRKSKHEGDDVSDDVRRVVAPVRSVDVGQLSIRETEFEFSGAAGQARRRRRRRRARAFPG